MCLNPFNSNWLKWLLCLTLVLDAGLRLLTLFAAVPLFSNSVFKTLLLAGGFLLIELSSPRVGYLTTAFTCLPIALMVKSLSGLSEFNMHPT